MRVTRGRHSGQPAAPESHAEARPAEAAAEDQPASTPAPPPPGVDVSTAHQARIWNYWLGGRDFFAVDQAAGDAIARQFPHVAEAARAQRAFGVRALRFLAGAARIRQFLDVGAGLPAGGNTHEIVQRIAPDSGIVYADNDPAVILHAKALLEKTGLDGGGSAGGAVSYLEADLRDVAAVLAGAAGTVDLARPVALVMLGALGHIDDYGAARSIVSQLMDELPAGSYLVIADSVATGPEAEEAQWRYNQDAPRVYRTLPYHLRRPDELASFFDGLALVEPCVVPCARWRPDGTPPGEAPAYCGVARKP